MNSSIDAERYLVTGSSGCIGAWVVREQLADHAHVVAYDLATDSHRMSMILDDIDITALVRVQADITDLDRLERTLDEHGITRVVHLAALQVPFCRANPPGGASVNVVGTANVFEAVAHRLEMIPHVVFASSIAAYDAFVPGVAPAMNATPSTVYGVYKRATEQMAELYFADRGVPSIALRPHTIYGPGRDQGLTSAAPSSNMRKMQHAYSFRPRKERRRGRVGQISPVRWRPLLRSSSWFKPTVMRVAVRFPPLGQRWRFLTGYQVTM